MERYKMKIKEGGSLFESNGRKAENAFTKRVRMTRKTKVRRIKGWLIQSQGAQVEVKILSTPIGIIKDVVK